MLSKNATRIHRALAFAAAAAHLAALANDHLTWIATALDVADQLFVKLAPPRDS